MKFHHSGVSRRKTQKMTEKHSIKKPEIQRTFVLSTGHLSKQEAQMLDNNELVIQDDWSYTLWVGMELKEVTESIYKILQMAKNEMDCDYDKIASEEEDE